MFRTISKAPTNPPPSQTFPLSQKTGTKITYDSEGNVVKSSYLLASDIPDLEISQITGLQDALDAAGDDWGSQVVEHDGTLDGDGTIGNPLTVLSAGSVDIIDITYADMATALSGATLTKGQFYRITDASGTDLGFITQAIREDEISVGGNGGFLNADFQAAGDYSGVAAETGTAAGTQLGIWRTSFEVITIPYTNLTGGNFAVGETITGSVTGATAIIVTDDGASSMTAYMTSAGVGFDGSEVLDNGAGVTADMDGAASSPTIVEGDIVIWNLIHWQLTDETVLDGTDPATNTAAYTELLRTVADVGYVTEWGISEFDFGNNQIVYRSDLRGNLVRGANGISDFQWGGDNCYENIVNTGALIALKNQLGNVFNNTLEPGAQIRDSNFLSESSEISECYFSSGAVLGNCNLIQSVISSCRLFNASEIDGITILANSGFRNCVLFQGAVISNITAGENLQFENNILENGASMTGITAGAGCVISTNKIGIAATLGYDIILGDNVTIEHNILENNAQFTGIEAGNGSTLSSNKVGQAATLGGSFVLEDDTHIDENSLSAGSSLFGITTTGTGCEVSKNNVGNDANMASLTLAGGTTVEYNILEPGATLADITAGAGCSISRNKIGQGATMGGSTTMGDGATMDDLEIRANKQLSNKTLDAGVTFSDKILEITIDGTETITANIEGNKAQPGFSDIPKSFDATGLTTLDWLAENNYVGIGNLSSSNATEAIDTISNFPTAFPFLLRPAAGLTLTVTGTAIASIGAGQIALTTADVVLNGDNGEWLELEADPNGGGFLREKNRSGTIL